MADKDNRVRGNVPGRYYVDTECIFCETCIDYAPENFASDGHEYAYVMKQPENKTEEGQCQEALEICLVKAIGDDGD